MKLAGESENYGTEQEHLNGIFGSRVPICALRAPSGFGIEFLDYLTPGAARQMPVDSRANDVWHWQTAVRVDRTKPAAEKLKGRGIRFVSSGVVTVPNRALGLNKEFSCAILMGMLFC